MVSKIQKHTKLMLVALGNMFLVLFVVMTTIVRIQCVFKANLRKIFAPGGPPVTSFPWPVNPNLYGGGGGEQICPPRQFFATAQKRLVLNC